MMKKMCEGWIDTDNLNITRKKLPAVNSFNLRIDANLEMSATFIYILFVMLDLNFHAWGVLWTPSFVRRQQHKFEYGYKLYAEK